MTEFGNRVLVCTRCFLEVLSPRERSWWWFWELWATAVVKTSSVKMMLERQPT